MTPLEALGDRSLPRNEALLLLACASGRTRESLLASSNTTTSATLAHTLAGMRSSTLASR